MAEFNFLGINLNEQFNWKNHIDKISNKFSRTLGILNRLKRLLFLNIKIILYNTLILPHLNYDITAWGYKYDRIQKLVRITRVSKCNAHTKPLFNSLKLLKIERILKLQELKLYYKFAHNKLPVYLQNLPLHQSNRIHNFNTVFSLSYRPGPDRVNTRSDDVARVARSGREPRSVRSQKLSYRSGGKRVH